MNKGDFSVYEMLVAKYPSGQAGWYATVNGRTYVWEKSSQTWVSKADDSDTLGGFAGSYYLDERNHTRNIDTYDEDTTLTALNRIVKIDCTSGDINITLPTSVGFIGQLDISKIDSTTNKVIVTPFSGQTIWGESTQEIVGRHDNITIIPDGTNWIII